MGGLIVKDLLVTAKQQQDERLRRWAGRQLAPRPLAARQLCVSACRVGCLQEQQGAGAGGPSSASLLLVAIARAPCAGLPDLMPPCLLCMPVARSLNTSAVGAVFYSVPHAGSRLADWGWSLRYIGGSPAKHVQHLKTGHHQEVSAGQLRSGWPGWGRLDAWGDWLTGATGS